MTEANGASRRALLIGAGGVTLGGAMVGFSPAQARANPLTPAHPSGRPASRRPEYHFSVPDNWKNDSQRPIYVDGQYLYFYLYNADYLTGGGGTAWRLATTRDHVAFRDRGVTIPKFSNANGDLWSGSVVVDNQGTAGYGRGAVVALITQAPDGKQAGYLWYSTDGGRSFQPGGTAPVLPNPGVADFRDPKVIWDTPRKRWLLVNAEGHKLGFYASPNLKSWSYVGGFTRDDIGVLECPDLFQMTAADGTSRWVLAASANGKGRGLPATYAYWTGDFDGTRFTPNADEPQWLDHGFDFYAAVTYSHHDRAGREDPRLRHAIGWANFWDYPHNTPTSLTDGYNGDDTIVRELRLLKDADGYYLASAPPSALRDYVTRTHRLGDVAVSGSKDLSIRSSAYELSCELTWTSGVQPNAGFQVCRAPGGGRHVDVGAYVPAPYAYVNRRPTANPTGGESQTPFDASSRRLKLRILVDRTSVELFVGDGRHVHSHRVFPLPGDDCIQLYAYDGGATFRDLTIREIKVR